VGERGLMEECNGILSAQSDASDAVELIKSRGLQGLFFFVFLAGSSAEALKADTVAC